MPCIPDCDDKTLDVYRRIQYHLDQCDNLMLYAPWREGLVWVLSCVTVHWPNHSVSLTQSAEGYCLSLIHDVTQVTHEMDWCCEDTSNPSSVAICKSGVEWVSNGGNWLSFDSLRTRLAQESLRLAGHNVPLAAQRLRVAPSTLYRWLDRSG